MKNILIVLSCFVCILLVAQAPQTINYQGVARDASGAAITTPIDLQFVIKDNTSAQVHIETQTGIQPNAFGVFSTQIGLTTAISPSITWKLSPYMLTVSLKSGATFTPMGSQQLASVPFALYAEKSGNSMPTGTVTGQTLFWDNAASVQKWKVDNNLSNDGSHVGVGVLPAGLKNKLEVLSLDPGDSSVVFASHLNAQSREAAFRGVASGNSPSNNSNPFTTAIYGSQFFGVNKGAGMAIGTYGQGLGDSLSVGVLGIGTATTSNGRSIGVYGSSPLPTGDNYAAVFDKGKVLINDSLYLGTLANPGNTGDVLTRSSTGKVRWMAAAAGSGPFTNSANFVHLTPSLNTNKVVIGNTTPTLFGYSSKLTVYNPTGSNDTALSVFQYTNSHALNSRSFGTGFAVNAVNSNAATNAFAGFFDGGLISKGKNSLPTSFAMLVKDATSTDLFTVRNDGHVGVGTNSQTENLQVQSPGSTSLSIISTSATTSNLFFGDQSLHSKGSIQYDNTGNTMNIGVNNTTNRIFINNNGNIGLKTNTPGPYDLSVFNPGSNTSIRLNNATSAGLGLVLATNNAASTLLSYENTPFSFGNNGATFMTALPNGNVGIGSLTPAINSRLAIKDGHLQSQQTTAPTIIGNNNATATFWNGNSTDVAGIIQLSMGAATLPGAQAVVTFNKTYNSTPMIVITPVNNFYGAIAVSSSQVYVVATNTGFTINFNTAYPTPSVTMYFNYIVIEGN